MPEKVPYKMYKFQNMFVKIKTENYFVTNKICRNKVSFVIII